MSVLINVNELIVNATKDVVREAIMEISRVYNFDGEEACRMLEVCSVAKSVSKVKSVKAVVKSVKSSFPLPFNGLRDDLCCQGVRQNHGLYTQCQGGRMNGGEFCKNCQTQCDKNGHGVPDYGTIGERMKAHEEGVEFVDPSGKSPTAYSIVMKKLKLNREQVEEEAGKLNIIINPIHFEEVAAKKSGRPAKADKPEKTESKQKGRPKKSKKVLELAGEEEDLFASLVMSANKTSEEEMSSDEEDKKTVIMSDSEDDEAVDKVVEPTVESVEKPVEKQKKKVISEAERLEKEAKKQALEAEKEAKKQALEAEKELAKQKKQALEAEKEAKKQALEAEKELAKQKKQALEAEKELAKQKKAAEEEKSKKDSTKQKKTKKEEAKPAAQVEDEEEADVVNKIEFEGKKYLRSKKTGIVYNMEQDVVGKWNVDKKRIDFNIEEEESEEEYEDDN